MTEGSLSVRVVSPETTVFEGTASTLVAPAWDGEVGILPRHAPMIVLLGQGRLSISKTAGGREEFWVSGGVLKVVDDGVTVLTEYASDQPPVEESAAELAGREGTAAASGF